MSYNGWENRETWLVALHIDNEFCLTDELNQGAEVFLCDADSDDDATESLSTHIEELVRDLIDQQSPDISGLASDFLAQCLSEVNWREIARGYIQEASA